jgi:hypothetical protein
MKCIHAGCQSEAEGEGLYCSRHLVSPTKDLRQFKGGEGAGRGIAEHEMENEESGEFEVGEGGREERTDGLN